MAYRVRGQARPTHIMSYWEGDTPADKPKLGESTPNDILYILSDGSTWIRDDRDWIQATKEAGIAGPAGLAGTPGAAGALGSAGVAGHLGPPGLEGEIGETGWPGAPGTAGAAGAVGAPGPSGATGPPGAEGDEGDAGWPGVPGVAGVAGATGSQGPTGSIVWLPGDDGADGEPGPPGKIGIDGAAGASGLAGPAIYLASGDGDDGYNGPPGVAGPAGAAGAPGTGITTKKLSADISNSTTTMVKVTNLDIVIGIGTWHFKYCIVHQSAATTTGIKFAVNHTGTVGLWITRMTFPNSLSAASDAIQDDSVLVGPFVTGSVATSRVKNETMGPTSGVITAAVNMMTIIEGLAVVTVSGNLELYHGSEVAAATTVKQDTMLMLFGPSS